jgi:hypothetical protein
MANVDMTFVVTSTIRSLSSRDGSHCFCFLKNLVCVCVSLSAREADIPGGAAPCRPHREPFCLLHAMGGTTLRLSHRMRSISVATRGDSQLPPLAPGVSHQANESRDQ